MTTYISFTSLWRNVVEGTVSLDDLLKEDSRIIFGCARSHVLCEDALVPYEVTRKQAGPEETHIYEDLNRETQALWWRFKSALVAAEAKGRVEWQFRGNYPVLERELLEAGETVFWHELRVPTTVR